MERERSSVSDGADVRVVIGWKSARLGGRTFWYLPGGGVRSEPAEPSPDDLIDWLAANTSLDGVFVRGQRYVLVATVCGVPVRVDDKSPSGYRLTDVLKSAVIAAHEMLR